MLGVCIRLPELVAQTINWMRFKWLVDVSDIFYFFCSGEGKGESGATWGGFGSLLKIPRRGGGLPGGVGKGREGVRRELGGGGGLNFVFFGAEKALKSEHFWQGLPWRTAKREK